MSATKVTYEIRVACGNCGINRRVSIATGVPVGAKACPRCGCKTLSAIHEPRL